MSEDDWGFTFEAPAAKTWGQTAEDDDVADDWDASEDEQEQKPAPVAAAQQATKAVPENTKPTTAAAKPPQTKQAKLRAEMIAQQQKAKADADAKAARLAALEAEERARRSDPDYLAKAKDRERAQMERAELDLIDDFLGDAEAAPVPQSKPEAKSASPQISEEQARRAAALAASTGLGDGADIARGIGIISESSSLPGDKTDVAAPNVLDTVSLATKEEIAGFTKQMCDKVNGLKSSPLALEFLKQIAQGISPQLKFDDLSDFLRVVTVLKNEAQKAQQNKKKVAKPGRAVLKSLGSAQDDYGTQYDDMF